MFRASFLRLAGFFIAVMLIAGCSGNPMAEVRGTVKYDGQLIEEGTIRFEDVHGKTPTAGGTIKGGQYTAQVPIGNMKVTISGAKVVGRKKLYANKDDTMELKGEALPEKYSDFQKTTLTFDVQAGVNEKNWDLSK